MQTIFRAFGAALVAGISLMTTGCGGYVSDHNLPAGSSTSTATENVRVWLQGVAQNGELDSGVSLIPDEIAKMKAEGVDNADKIEQEFDQLESQKGPAAIKTKANAILNMLPKE